jgi:hypothetical protein
MNDLFQNIIYLIVVYDHYVLSSQKVWVNVQLLLNLYENFF